MLICEFCLLESRFMHACHSQNIIIFGLKFIRKFNMIDVKVKIEYLTKINKKCDIIDSFKYNERIKWDVDFNDIVDSIFLILK